MSRLVPSFLAQLTPRLVWLFALLPLAGAQAQEPEFAGPDTRVLINRTAGMRFDPPYLSIAEAPSDPKIVYVGTSRGLVMVTHDGGKSWSERPILMPRWPFYGALRAQGNAPQLRLDTWLPGYLSPGDLITGTGISFGPTGGGSIDNLLVTSEYADRKVRSDYNSAIQGRPLATASGGGGGADLGVGLRATAPRLALAVRKKRSWGVGISLKQTLAMRSGPRIQVNGLSVDPDDPNIVFAATADGLFMTTDGGLSWPNVLTGKNVRERRVNMVVRDPHRRERLYALTGLGLYSSEDGGNSWGVALHPRVGQADVRWMDFHPTDPNTRYVGVWGGLLKTTDDGTTYQRVFRSPWPAQNLARRVVVDPNDPRRILLGTADGLMISEDGGKSFERGGGLQFVGSDIRALSASGVPGHFVCGDLRDMWETRDSGKTWQVAFFGSVGWDVRMGLFSQHRKGSLWIVTTAEVLELGQREGPTATPETKRRFLKFTSVEPTLSETVQTALEFMGAWRPNLVNYRRRARWAGLMPEVKAVARWLDVGTGLDVRNFNVDNDTFFSTTGTFRDFDWGVFTWWDVRRIISDRAESPMDRVGGVNRRLAWNVRTVVIALYQERHRLIFDGLLNEGSESLRARLMRRLRLEELTAHLNALSGEIFEPMPAL